MTDFNRSGGFGGIGLGPFHTGGGDFSRYNLGDLQTQTAALDKYAAEVAWNNGLITDAAYVKALREYVGSTAKDSRERISANNELLDALYTIGRNTRVRRINDSQGTQQRISGWHDLISWDRSHLSTMTHDNQQWAELRDRIASEEGDLRKEGWAALVKRYNNGGMSTARMLTAARRLAGQSGGGPDHQDWLTEVDRFTQIGLDEQQTTLETDYNTAKLSDRKAKGRAVLDFLDQRLAGLSEDSPQYVAMARHRDQWAKGIHDSEVSAKDAEMDQRFSLGHVTDDAYLGYFQRRLSDAPKGSDEQRQLRSKVYQVAFTVSEKRAQGAYQQTGDPSQLIDVYLGAQAGMTRGSQAWTSLQQQIASLQADAYQTFSLLDPAGALGAGFSPGGHLAGPGSFGTPVGGNGFASQYDGSRFGYENCVSGDAIVATDRGLVRLARVAANGGQTHDTVGMNSFMGAVSKGDQRVVRVNGRWGYGVTVTPDHKIMTYDPDARDLALRPASDIRTGDTIILQRGTHTFGEDIDSRVAEMLGIVAGDGSVSDRGVSFVIDTDELGIMDSMDAALRIAVPHGEHSSLSRCLDHDAWHRGPAASEKVTVLRRSCDPIVRWFQGWDLKADRLSDRVLSLGPQSLAAFLRGLFEADGCATKAGAGQAIMLATRHEGYAHDVQRVLLALGVVCNVRDVSTPTPYKLDRTLWNITIADGSRAEFIRQVGFISARKSDRAAAIGDSRFAPSDKLPFMVYKTRDRRNVRDAIASHPGGRWGQERERNVRVLDWIERGLLFVPVVSVDDAGIEEVFDLVETPTHLFVPDGVVASQCVYAAAAMLAWGAGVTGLSGGAMRWYAGDTDGGAGFMSDVGHAFGQLGLGTDQHVGMNLDAFRRKVVNGHGALLIGIYGNLSGAYRLSSFSGGHGVYVDAAKKGRDGRWYYYVMDPLGRSADQGAQWWSEEALQAFGWSGMTNPTSGTRSFGNVVFATGGRNRVTVNRDAVPFQAFDTDANGRSTVGRGGGTNRGEAGYRPPNWRQKPDTNAGGTGAPSQAPKGEVPGTKGGPPKQTGGRTAKEQEVRDFMGALASAGGRDAFTHPGDRSPESEQVFRDHAAKAWEQGGGDPRLAAIAYFSGQPANPDSATWTDNQRFYANGVGNQYGQPSVPKGGLGIISPGAKPIVASGGTPPYLAQPPEGAPGQQEVQETPPGGAPPKAQPKVDTAGDAIARRFLAGIGAQDTPENRRAVKAMLTAQFGDKPQPLNIFGLKTTGPNDLPGQTGTNGGWAVFSDPGASIDAAATDMVNNPRFAMLLSAFRRGDPKGIADALPTSGWDDAAFGGNRFAHTYNSPDLLGDAKPIYPQVSNLDTPSSMADLAAKVPSLELLINGDPTDPVWKAWYDGNRDAILDAEKNDRSTWQYTPPGATTPIELPMNRGLAIDIADNNYLHAQQLSDIARQGGDTDAAAAILNTARGSLTDVTMETAGDVLDGMDQLAQDAMAKGDAFGAANIYNAEIDFITYGVAGVPDVMRDGRLVRNSDATMGTNPLLGQDEKAALGERIDKLSRPTSAAGILLGLMEPSAAGINGFTEDGQINPDRGFWTQIRDETTQRMVLRPVSDRTAPDLFNQVDVIDDTGATRQVPLYRHPTEGKMIPVTLPGGGLVYQPIETSRLPVTVYAPSPMSPAKMAGAPMYGSPEYAPWVLAHPNLALVPSAGPGPLEMRPSTQITGLQHFTTVDPSDMGPNQRLMHWWSLDGFEWVGTSANEMPALVATVPGAFTKDPATGNMLLDGNPVKDADYARTFKFYGLQDGADPYGKAGVGAPGRRHPVRHGSAGSGGFDATLVPMERLYEGGDQWAKRDQNAWRALFPPSPTRAGPGPHPQPSDADREAFRAHMAAGSVGGGAGGPVISQSKVDALRDTVPWGSIADTFAAATMPRYASAQVNAAVDRVQVANKTIADERLAREAAAATAAAMLRAAPRTATLRTQIDNAGGVLPRSMTQPTKKPATQIKVTGQQRYQQPTPTKVQTPVGGQSGGAPQAPKAF